MYKKGLAKSDTNRIISGVAGGVAEHLGIDSTVVRLGFVVLAFCTGFTIMVVVYVILCIGMPSSQGAGQGARQGVGQRAGAPAPSAAGPRPPRGGTEAPGAGGRTPAAEDQRPRAEDLKRPDVLRAGFLGINSAAGLKALRNLTREYGQLRLILKQKDEAAPLAVAYIPPLSEETYRQGLSVLADALHLMRAVHSSSQERLEAEIVELEWGIETFKQDETQAARVKIREDTVASHKERLEMLKQQQLRVDELLYQSHRCEVSLGRAGIELAALQADGSEANVDMVVDTLQATIDQAREVKEELKRLGI